MAGRFGGGRMWRWLAAVLVCAVSVSVVAVPVAAQEAGSGSGGFGDVAQDAFYADAVEALASGGVFAGTECAEGFCGDEVIDRKTMAVWVVRTVDGEDPAAVTVSRFDDVDASGFHAPFIERMAALNVTAGCGDGSGFCPDDTVDRAQMAVFLSRAFDLADGPDPGFGDVPATAWFAAEVAKLAASGITVGCGGSNFCPDRATKRAEMAVFLARATGKIQTPQRVTQAPAVLLSYTTPEAMHGSEAWPSPDWRHVAYLANVTRDSDWGWAKEGDLYVAAADGSNLTKVASGVLGDESCAGDGPSECGYPAVGWSPDGSRFWYITIEDRDDQGEATSYSLSVAAADGTRSVQLTQDSPGIRRGSGGLEPGGWSPDSQHIAYIIKGDASLSGASEGDDAVLFVAAADGTNPTRLTDGDSYWWWDVAWSSDSRHIAYENRDGVLYSARADGTNPSELAAARDYWGWSPDGSRIAYRSNADGALYSVLADGSGTVKLGDRFSDVVWSPDSRHIAYEDRQAGVRTLYSARADGSGAVKLGDGAHYVGWSPDGSHIAYEDYQAGVRTLYSARADGSGAVKLGDGAHYVGWSPDGSRIAYLGLRELNGVYTAELYTALADGSGIVKLGDGARYAGWSPDGSHIAYQTGSSGCTTRGDLFTARADGSKATKLSDSAIEPVWSPDSTRIAYWKFELDPEAEDYDPEVRHTWLYDVSVEVSGIGGASIAKFATGKVGRPCNFAPHLAWRPDGIEAELVWSF